MAGIQATYILHLLFAVVNNHWLGAAAFSCIQTEFKKIKRVFIKAEQLRFKALELMVKKVPCQTDAA